MSTNLYTYNSLLTAILVWCNRSQSDATFVNQIPIFITLTEQQMFSEYTTLGNQVYATSAFKPNDGFIQKPALWGKTLTLNYLDAQSNITVVQRATYESSLMYSGTYTANGSPVYYQDYGYNFIKLIPTPQIAYNFELAYLEKTTPLSPNIQSNWNTINAYDILFYGSLEKAYLYLDNTQKQQEFLTRFREAAGFMSSYDQGRLLDRTADSSMKQLSQPPQAS